ncbi:MAG TPA: hypothetical protein VN623_02710 [Hyphomicrobium sp.]|jgi:hypothetical protein|uniref:hypothetical protein n=1 Tax=Hyphomicrobium sp. TaxID=82 RepID=UPI002C251D31|nr:hypothetical protein [Hyphomicrobium sp.]HXE00841.1 hypothetical protein [Hyphomicrobium sp.]
MAGLGITAVISAAAMVLLQGPAIADDCLNDWGLAGQIVRQEKLITVEEVAKSLTADGVGQLVKTTLCRSAEGYFYRIVIRSPTGQLKSSVMSARSR